MIVVSVTENRFSRDYLIMEKQYKGEENEQQRIWN